MSEEITLHHGELTFSALTAGEGPLVICLHGFPDCKRSFRFQLPTLANAGYKAVSVSLRGYEPSAQPKKPDYSMPAIASDIIAFLDELKTEKAYLVGHDWGASIAYTVAAFYPERIQSLTTIAVPHAGRFVNEAFTHSRQLRLSWYMFFFQLRYLSDYIVKRNNYAFVRKLWRDWSPGWNAPEEELEAVIETLSQPGVCRAALAYYREALAPSNWPLSKAKRQANRFSVPVPTLAITGETDHCIAPDIFEALIYEEDFPRGVRCERVPQAGHFPHQEQPEVVNKLLLDWLQSHS